MGPITLKNVRASSDITVNLRLKDGGMYIAWTSLSDIKAYIFSDVQRAIAGRCDVSIDGDDSTLLICNYSANKPQYLGINSIVVRANYDGRVKTYDRRAFNIVKRTSDVSGDVVLDDPVVDLELEVTDVSSSILDKVILATLSAADRADAAAAEAEHMVDIKTGPAGKSPYKGKNGNWFEWDEEAGQYVDTGVRAKGETGDTPDISIGTVATVEPGEPAAASMTGSPEAPVLNLSIPKGLVGATPNFTVGKVTTGQPGTPVVVTITGTAEDPVLNITIPQGLQGNPGSSVDYPFELVNNEETDDPLKAHTAAGAKRLKDAVNGLQKKTQNINYIPATAADESVEFQTDGGEFIAKVSPNGVEAKDVKVEIENERISLSGIYMDPSVDIDDDLSFGDKNKHNIVQFAKGHIRTKNFNSEQVVSDIEELKRGGSTGVIDDKAQRRMAFKEDFFSYKYGKANSAWYERLRIMHYSDTHRNIVNLKEALDLAQGLVHLVLDTGDNANGGPYTPASSTITELNDYLAAEEEVNTAPMPMLICGGNHDVPNLTKKQYFDIMCSIVAETNPSYIFGDAANYRTYGYVDITPNATIGTVRVIGLDPFDYDDGQFMNPYGASGGGAWMNCVFSQKQIDWLIATLRSAANNGYKVITAMHYSWGDNPVFTDSGSANPDANYHQDPFMIPDIIDAMQNRAALSKSYQDDENINNITVDEDFSGLTNPLDFVCHLFGHIHSENEYQCQKTDGSKFYDILMVGAPNMGSEGYAINKVPLQSNTINSIKCTVLEIDTVEKNIYRVNYGAYKAYDMSNTERTKKIHYRFNS